MRGYHRSILPGTILLLLGGVSLAAARPVLSPALRAIDAGSGLTSAVAISEQPGLGTVIDLFLEGDVDDAALAALGVQIGSRLPGGIVTARAPVARLGELAGLPGLTRITAGYRLKKSNSLSVPGTLATPNYWTASPPNFTGAAGQGVVVGIVDTGIDWTHSDFKNPDGTTRILALWDQNASGGALPPGFAYGSYYTATDINTGGCSEIDADGHGTHVAGSAAGDGSGTGNGQPANVFIGMAPRADIIAVATNFSTTGVVDGVNFIFQRAAALGKPAVVNLSLGSQFGAHDGTETFDASLNSLTGAGHIVVAAAGNEGGQSLHAEQLVPPGPSQSVTFSVPTYTAATGAGNDYVVIDAYYTGTASISVTLTSPGPSPVTVGPVALGASLNNAGSLAGNIYVENGVTPSPSGLRNLYIQIYDSNSTRPPRVGIWTVTLTPVSTTASTECDLWLANFGLGSAGVQPLFASDVDEAELVASPASATNVIAVAAFTTRPNWPAIDGGSYSFVGAGAVGTIASFSCPGPRRDGVPKPDIAAPGTAIVSALSTSVASAPPQALVNPDGVHWTLQGTSMAAPHVTGGVALILGDQPALTPAQVKARLTVDALVDGFTGPVPNAQWGSGKLRMLRADLQAPSVTVTSPNGGESWAIGSVHAITWTATDNMGVTSVDIAWSANNGGSWTTLSLGEVNDGSYSWTLPASPTAQALVRVTARDAAGNSTADPSNALFSVVDLMAPSVTVNAPNGGESWVGGSVHDITWTAIDNVAVSSVDIAWSANNGGSWTNVSLGEANDGVYSWTVPAQASTQALVRVTGRDAAGNATADASNMAFTVVANQPPQVTLSAPNGGGVVIEGASVDITWNATDDIAVTSIDLAYTTNDGASWWPIASGEANDGLYHWTAPGVTTALARVRVTAHDAAGVNSDISDASFAITALTAAPELPAVLVRPMVLQNHPNPFNPTTVIGFGLPEAAPVSIRIYSSRGQLIRQLASGSFSAGYSQVVWDGRADDGRLVASGVYFYRFESGPVVTTRRMIVSK